jgi:hypothetical protein
LTLELIKDEMKLIKAFVSSPGQMVRIIFKALVLFLMVDLVFGAINPVSTLGRLSGYNWLFPGRVRLPYGDDPKRAYNLTLYDLDTMLASHEISASKLDADEYHILLIGDSSTWGYLLPPDQTLASFINRSQVSLPDGRRVRAYNLGYPVMSVTKDLLILSKTVQYQPDLILWLFTLESFPDDKQLYSPLLQNNVELVQRLTVQTQLQSRQEAAQFDRPSFFAKTIIGQRRALADWIWLQFYGIMWAATGVDQDIPATYPLRQSDLSDDLEFHNLKPPHLHRSDLALDVLAAGVKLAGNIPVLFVNEPMFVSQGNNSNLRYNFYYPRWAYDDYRQIVQNESLVQHWFYLDLWDFIPPEEFTNSAVHLSPDGSAQLAQRLIQAVLELPR